MSNWHPPPLPLATSRPCDPYCRLNLEFRGSLFFMNEPSLNNPHPKPTSSEPVRADADLSQDLSASHVPTHSLSTTPGASYLAACRELVEIVNRQLPQIQQAADWFAESILAGRMVHLFGAGHSRILVEEMWPRYGSFPGFHPIVELSLTFHNQVVGANGQRQAMFLENVPGLAARILRNFDLSPQDSALVASSGGCNVTPIEMAAEFRQRGIKVVAVVSRRHSEASSSNHSSGQKLTDHADLVLDTGAPIGDAMVWLPGLATPVSPGSTVGGCMVINALKAEVAARLIAAGHPPRVLTASAIVGRQQAAALFEAAYDEHARRIARLYAQLGLDNGE